MEVLKMAVQQIVTSSVNQYIRNHATHADNFMAESGPIPLDDNGDPKYTPSEWVNMVIKAWILDGIGRGSTKRVLEAASVEEF